MVKSKLKMIIISMVIVMRLSTLIMRLKLSILKASIALKTTMKEEDDCLINSSLFERMFKIFFINVLFIGSFII